MKYVITIESHNDTFYLFSYSGYVDEWVGEKDAALTFDSFRAAEIAKKNLRDQNAKIEEY